MTSRLHVEHRDSYLYARAAGPSELAAAKEFFQQILSACKKHNISNVLYDCRLAEGAFSTMERYNYGAYIADAIRKSGVVPRFAYVGTEQHIDPDRFGETVAVNRGVVLKVTTDLCEALDWLGVEDSQMPGF